jgi:hypothetical protein
MIPKAFEVDGVTKAGWHRVDKRLWLRVMNKGRKHWYFQYRLNGKQIRTRIGSYPDLDLMGAWSIVELAHKSVTQNGEYKGFKIEKLVTQNGQILSGKHVLTNVAETVKTEREIAWKKVPAKHRRPNRNGFLWLVEMLRDGRREVRIPTRDVARVMGLPKVKLSRGLKTEDEDWNQVGVWCRWAVDAGLIAVAEDHQFKGVGDPGNRAKVYKVSVRRLREQLRTRG